MRKFCANPALVSSFLMVGSLCVSATAVLSLGDSGLGASNCGFLTIEQCRATVSGGSSFCVPNQFYNPHVPAKRTHNRALLTELFRPGTQTSVLSSTV
jgi:Protein of unknown function (DUF3551)